MPPREPRPVSSGPSEHHKASGDNGLQHTDTALQMTASEERGRKDRLCTDARVRARDVAACPRCGGSAALEAGRRGPGVRRDDRLPHPDPEHAAHGGRCCRTSTGRRQVPRGRGGGKPDASGQRCGSSGDRLGGHAPAFHGPAATRNSRSGPGEGWGFPCPGGLAAKPRE